MCTDRFLTAEPAPSPAGGGEPQGGFALAVVMVLLFAIGVAGATGYQIVSQEAQLSIQVQEANQAMTLAQAGLYRFLGEPTRGVRDSVQYSLDGGTATVTTRLIKDVEGEEKIYSVRSVGNFADPRYSNTPAERTVTQVAIQRQMPFTPIGAVASTAVDSYYYNSNYTSSRSLWPVVQGNDISSAADCSEGGSLDVDGFWAGYGHTIYFDADSLTGTPVVASGQGGPGAIAAATGLDWSLLTDTEYPVDQEGTLGWPDFGAIPSDSFPVIRINGSFYPGSTFSGRGVLIVRDRFRPADGFDWDGLILAGYSDYLYARMTIRGALLTGFGATISVTWVYDEARIYFHYCNVLEAARQLTYLEPVDNSWAELF
jgi:hypothetical protein